MVSGPNQHDGPVETLLSGPCVGDPPTCCQPEPLTFEELLGPVPGGQRCLECGSSWTAPVLLPTVLGEGMIECWECRVSWRND